MPAEKITHFYACQIATTNSVKQHKLRKRIASLSDKEGRGKEFISLYIPPETPIDQVIANLKKESELMVRESERLRERFQNALKNIIQQLKEHKEIPENGLALFAGTLVTNGTDEVLSVEEIVPPEPIITYLYAVDVYFRLETLREMLRDKKIVGILALDSKEANFGLLNGEHLKLMKNITSGISGKTTKGGQSQRRYERERDMAITHFFHRIAEHASNEFIENRVNVLIVGGPGPTKNDFLKGNYLHYELTNMLLNVVDTQSAGKEAIREVFDKSSEILKNMCEPEEKRIVQRLMVSLSKQDGLATYGLDSVLAALKKGEVQVALVTDNTDIVENVVVCKRCGHTRTKIASKKAQNVQEMIARPCEKCKGISYQMGERDIIDVLEDVASQTDANVEVISTTSEEKTSLTALGGFAALLRYKSG